MASGNNFKVGAGLSTKLPIRFSDSAMETIDNML